MGESTLRQQIHSFEPSCPVVAQPPGPSEIDRASFKMPEATATPRHEPEDPSEEGSVGLPDLGDSIDAVTFEQILEMDDDEDEPDEDKCLERIKDTLVTVKEEYAEVEKVLKKFYGS